MAIPKDFISLKKLRKKGNIECIYTSVQLDVSETFIQIIEWEKRSTNVV